MEAWLTDQGHNLFCTRLWAGDALPSPDSFSALIVMGGPMGIYDNEEYPWLPDEKAFLVKVIERETPILGICLGAQLLADVLGADVTANWEKEIGWFPVQSTNDMPAFLAPIFPKEMKAFHWHGDTFSLPDNSVCIFESTACKNQAFLYKKHVLGLQFHLETTRDSAATLIDNCRDELVRSPWIMSEKEMLNPKDDFRVINNCMHKLLREFFPL